MTAFMHRPRVWRGTRVRHATIFIAVVIVLLAVSALAVARASEAQQMAPLLRVGFLLPLSLSDLRGQRFLQAFRQGLRELGYVEGQNIAIELRSAEGQCDRLPGLAAELVRLKVNVIVAGGPPAIQAAKPATETIPIVMAAVADPVAAGFVASLGRPGGNITGISNMVAEMVGKQLELLREVRPKVSRVALLGNPTNPNHGPQVRHAQDAARALGIRLQPLEVRDLDGITRAFAAISTERADAVIVLTDTVLLDHRTRIADHASRHRLPTVFAVSEFVEGGGLLSYGPSLTAGVRRAAAYVDKIHKGAKPADLPVEQPLTLELVINLNTAQALGLTIPQTVLQRADRIIP